MKNDLATDFSQECYVVEVDGIARMEYRIFVKALRAGLQLKQQLPNSRVKVRDAGEEAPTKTDCGGQSHIGSVSRSEHHWTL